MEGAFRVFNPTMSEVWERGGRRLEHPKKWIQRTKIMCVKKDRSLRLVEGNVLLWKIMEILSKY